MEYELKPFCVENQRDVHRCQGLGDTGVATSSLYLSTVCQVQGCTSFTLASSPWLLGITPGCQEPQLWVWFRTKGKAKGHRVCFLKPGLLTTTDFTRLPT